MKDESEKPVSHEMWYEAQLMMRRSIENIEKGAALIIENQSKNFDTSRDIQEKILIQATKTNGRVLALEEWSKDEKKVIEGHGLQIGLISKFNERLMGGIIVLVFCIATIGYFFLQSIDNKIADGINNAFDERFSKVEITK